MLRIVLAVFMVLQLAGQVQPVKAEDDPPVFLPTVAVLDTGIQSNTALLNNVSLSWVDLVGDSTGTSRAEPYDDNGHGTMVASLVVELANISHLAVAKVLDGFGRGSPSLIAEGIYWAREVASANVIVVPIYTPLPDVLGEEPVEAALRFARASGALVVWAAGNGLLGFPYVPSSLLLGAASTSSLVVGAASESGEPAAFSNHDPEILAPGINLTFQGPEGTERASGTSAAAAWVGGFAARLLTAVGQERQPCQIEDAVLASAKDRPEYGNDIEGFGLVDEESFDAALAILQEAGNCIDRAPTTRGEAVRLAMTETSQRRFSEHETNRQAKIGSPAGRFQTISGVSANSGLDAGLVMVEPGHWNQGFLLTASGATGTEDPDAVFLNEWRRPITSFHSQGPESGRVPHGTRWVELVLTTGADATFVFEVGIT